MITTMFFILVPFLKRAPCIIIHLARNAEKGGGVLMSIILPNLNHSFVPDSGSGSGFRIPDSGSVSGFQISGFSIRPEKRSSYRKLGFHLGRIRNFTLFSFSLHRRLHSCESFLSIIEYIDPFLVKT